MGSGVSSFQSEAAAYADKWTIVLPNDFSDRLLATFEHLVFCLISCFCLSTLVRLCAIPTRHSLLVYQRRYGARRNYGVQGAPCPLYRRLERCHIGVVAHFANARWIVPKVVTEHACSMRRILYSLFSLYFPSLRSGG